MLRQSFFGDKLLFMSTNKKKNDFYEESARTFKLLGSPVKLKLLNYVSFCPRTVEDCAEKFCQSVQNISLHLIALAKAGVLDVEQIKNYRYYSLSNNRIAQVVSKAILSDPRALLPDELIWSGPYSDIVSGIELDKLVIIDLRDKDESSYLPINKSLHFDAKLTHLLSFLGSIPKSKTLVFICKGRMCERLAEAVELANDANYKVKGLPLSAMELREFGQYLN